MAECTAEELHLRKHEFALYYDDLRIVHAICECRQEHEDNYAFQRQWLIKTGGRGLVFRMYKLLQGFTVPRKVYTNTQRYLQGRVADTTEANLQQLQLQRTAAMQHWSSGCEYSAPAAAVETPVPLYCDVCGETACSVCSSCHARRYCSRECQKADWKVRLCTIL
jgi:MYND finger